MRRLLSCTCLAIALALAGCASREGSRALHQWTDAAGNVRYTAFPEEIPSPQRHTRRLVEAGATARAAPPPAPVDVAAARAPVEPPAEPPPPADTPLDARIAELEARIETEQEALKALISDPAVAAELRGSPQLREIGERLPALQSQLEDLRQQRAEAARGGDGGEQQAAEGRAQ